MRTVEHRNGRGCIGFTLLEVMVAVSILGISLVIIMQLFSMGLKSSTIDRDYSRALILARTKLGEFMVQKDLEEGQDSGSFDEVEEAFGVDYEWFLEVSEYEPPVSEETEHLKAAQPGLDPDNDELPYKLLALKLQVRWQSGGQSNKSVSLTSLRLVQNDDDLLTSPASPGEGEAAPEPALEASSRG
ncbi:prepilin-type N-terminal cleavage/methylation domain-containing protein [bacterium]|nr:prepilin-type N-terminal cleavage/methylation domain-containing protein [bacterium]